MDNFYTNLSAGGQLRGGGYSGKSSVTGEIYITSCHEELKPLTMIECSATRKRFVVLAVKQAQCDSPPYYIVCTKEIIDVLASRNW